MVGSCEANMWDEVKGQVKELTDINFGLGCFSEEEPELFLSRCIDGRLVGFLSYSRGVLSTVIVAEGFVRRGIGESLVRELVSRVNGDIKAFCWVNEGVVGLRSILVRNGFEEGELLRSFWHDDSIEFEFSCVNCGHPCECDAILFERAGVQE